MKLLRNIIIKEIVTEEKKTEMIADFELEVTQSERELEQLSFQLYKTTKEAKNKQDMQAIRMRYTGEIKKRREKLESYRFKLEQLRKLEIGTEIRTGTAEAIVEINIGDKWIGNEQTEMIIKDGIVHEIREGRNLYE